MRLQITLGPDLEALPIAETDVEEKSLRRLWARLKPAVLEFQSELDRDDKGSPAE